MNIYEKLLTVQSKLKAPKSQFNSFGKYNYRNAEDILEAVKPLCAEVGALVILTDEVVFLNERYYVKATAKFIDTTPINGTIQFIDVSASAREEYDKKGMDGSQITGASSSYARKYALNGLFAIDDTKDSDSTNTHGKDEKKDDKKINKPFPEVPEEEKAMTLEEALAVEVLTKDGTKKLKDLNDNQLRLGIQFWAQKEWKDGAEIVLKSREQDNVKGQDS